MADHNDLRKSARCDGAYGGQHDSFTHSISQGWAVTKKQRRSSGATLEGQPPSGQPSSLISHSLHQCRAGRRRVPCSAVVVETHNPVFWCRDSEADSGRVKVDGEASSGH